LSNFALFKNACPPSGVVDRLCDRGFLVKTARGPMAIQSNQDHHLTTGQLARFSFAAIVLLVFAWSYIN
jgi:hypothetical protein